MSQSQDSQDLRDRVTEILNAAETSSGSMLGDGDGESEGDGAGLLETAEEASDLLESADPDDLLAAVGLDTLPDGSEPDSIPEAIARGDPEQVAELQRLLHLSNLADSDDGDDGDEGALESAVDDLRASIGDGESAADDSEGDDETAEDESDGDETGGDDGLLDVDIGSSDKGDQGDEAAAEGDGAAEDASESETEDESGGVRDAVESAAETVSEASGLDGVLEGDESDDRGDQTADDGGEAETDEDEGSDIGDRLRSAVESSLTDVGDDLEGLHDRLQERSASSVGGGDSEGTSAEDEAEAEEGDDGLLGSGLGSSDEGGGDGTRHSTMAPPPSKRADMKTTRHSTMPKRH